MEPCAVVYTMCVAPCGEMPSILQQCAEKDDHNENDYNKYDHTNISRTRATYCSILQHFHIDNSITAEENLRFLIQGVGEENYVQHNFACATYANR